jgi:hypothetical protein
MGKFGHRQRPDNGDVDLATDCRDGIDRENARFILDD